ncbi:MAG: integration host factor subunit alpha [Desulfobacterales bacterium]
MALTKAEIIEAVAEGNGFSKKQATDTVEMLLEIVKRTLASGEDVLVSGFGKFCVKEKTERRGRNPATGDAMMLRPRRVVTFKCSGKLREKIDSSV